MRLLQFSDHIVPFVWVGVYFRWGQGQVVSRALALVTVAVVVREGEMHGELTWLY